MDDMLIDDDIGNQTRNPVNSTRSHSRRGSIGRARTETHGGVLPIRWVGFGCSGWLLDGLESTSKRARLCDRSALVPL